MLKTLRIVLYRLGVPEPWSVDPDRLSSETVRAHLRHLETRGVEQVVSKWPWPTQGARD